MNRPFGLNSAALTSRYCDVFYPALWTVPRHGFLLPQYSTKLEREGGKKTKINCIA